MLWRHHFFTFKRWLTFVFVQVDRFLHLDCRTSPSPWQTSTRWCRTCPNLFPSRSPIACTKILMSWFLRFGLLVPRTNKKRMFLFSRPIISREVWEILNFFLRQTLLRRFLTCSLWLTKTRTARSTTKSSSSWSLQGRWQYDPIIHLANLHIYRKSGNIGFQSWYNHSNTV